MDHFRYFRIFRLGLKSSDRGNWGPSNSSKDDTFSASFGRMTWLHRLTPHEAPSRCKGRLDKLLAEGIILAFHDCKSSRITLWITLRYFKHVFIFFVFFVDPRWGRWLDMCGAVLLFGHFGQRNQGLGNSRKIWVGLQIGPWRTPQTPCRRDPVPFAGKCISGMVDSEAMYCSKGKQQQTLWSATIVVHFCRQPRTLIPLVPSCTSDFNFKVNYSRVDGPLTLKLVSNDTQIAEGKNLLGLLGIFWRRFPSFFNHIFKRLSRGPPVPRGFWPTPLRSVCEEIALASKSSLRCLVITSHAMIQRQKPKKYVNILGANKKHVYDHLILYRYYCNYTFLSINSKDWTTPSLTCGAVLTKGCQ